MTDAATRVQNEASDPRRSTWLSANAGSGKTRVLTDRVARLLLQGTRPQDILCLTYTKAAASEMQNRLFRTLGQWAMMPDADLEHALAAIGERADGEMERARTLFARAIETPGGLRIQTIHSFCAGLIRQFPVEAGVTPEFRELDTDEADRLLSRAVDEMAEADAPALTRFLACHDGDALATVTRTIAAARTSFQVLPDFDDLSRRAGVSPGDDIETLDTALLGLIDADWWRALKAALLGTNATNEAIAARMPDDPKSLSRQDIGWFQTSFANKTNDNSKAGKWPAKPLRAALGAAVEGIDAFLDGVIEHRTARRGVACRDNAARLHAFAAELLDRYRTLKVERGVLDFDDLIQKTAALLRDETRAWVRFRLDNRIEHILIDEAQDTSPEQWQVISALADEIVAGEGADGRARSLFVVGDRKQSIYSFQGADARAFDHMQSHFDERMRHAPKPLALHRLEYSFRSSTAILTATDAVFDALSSGEGVDSRHKAFFADLPGRVDLWPVVEPGDAPDDPAWFDPVDRPLEEASQIRLADAVAREIARLVAEEAIPQPNQPPRPVAPGDILVLVQRRGILFERIIRTSQALGVEIAGPDRLRLFDEVAVRDILAILRFLALPEDDLSLAEALRSPILGLDEAELYDLAHARTRKRLWRELVRRREDFAGAHAILSDLLRHADFLRPFEMIERILIEHEGRARLLARLGEDAEDALDELLSLALDFESEAIPDLTSFLAHVETLETDVKRAAEGSGRKVRVMTVHGAKGLEAPIVILPDTIRVARADRAPVFLDVDGVPFLKAPSTEAAAIQTDATTRRAAAERAEAQRLLYVAMTRAETWLIVCGAEGRRKGGFWHQAVADGLATLPTVEIDTPVGPGLRLAHGDWPARPGVSDDARDEAVTAFTILGPVPDAVRSVTPLNPSDLGGAKTLAGGLGREDALPWGSAIHLLLEHLPDHPHADRHRIAAQVLANADLPPDLVDPIAAAEAAGRVIAAHPDLFTGDALREVPLAGHVGGIPFAGTVDLMLIEGERVRIVDFKTNALVPKDAGEVPDAILRQMGAYLVALRTALPGHKPELQILWTETGALMTLPHAIVSAAFAATTTS